MFKTICLALYHISGEDELSTCPSVTLTKNKFISMLDEYHDHFWVFILIKITALITLIFMNPFLYAAGVVLNNPYPSSESTQKDYYSSFTEQPKTLDPATSYTSNESLFLGQIYEPVLQYDYLKRPYTLVPLTAAVMPKVVLYDKLGKRLNSSLEGEVASSVYTIHIKHGIMFQPHPAFAKDTQGEYEYLNLPAQFFEQHDIHQLSDFKHMGTRELTAEDYVYQIKRLADPYVNSPIYGLMGEHIVGFLEYATTLPDRKQHPGFLDLRTYPLTGVRLIDSTTYEVTLKGEYPQFIFWLAMSFFSPIPWEVDRFYTQAGMRENNLTFSWYPVGTGPFMLTENNPNRRMVLTKNPNFHEEYFPSEGSEEDKAHGYLAHAGERIPLIDRVIFVLEKESLPRWNKFLQGYYDLSGVAEDSFDQVIDVKKTGEIELTPQMRKKGIQLQEVTQPALYYLGFNMLDPIVGGTSKRARLLRQAIAIAVDYDENISIFYNGRGESIQGPIPKGIFGYRAGPQGLNPYVYTWKNNQKKRRSIQEARDLMTAAGYPGGIDKTTRAPLILHYDVASTGAPDEKAILNWMTKEFARIGIDLDIRTTQYNRFQEKIRYGNAQLFSWGWVADYPDPENFLFLLYGPNGKLKSGGENVTNYSNPEFDRLFDQMKNRQNDTKRQDLIDKMIEILRYDAPWAGGINPSVTVLRQPWMTPVKPSGVAQNNVKYVAIDIDMRNQLRAQWNQAILWPAFLLMFLLLIFILPFWMVYRQSQRLPVQRMRLK